MSGRYWILTIPHHEFTPYLPAACQYIRGQLERGAGTGLPGSGFLHWQVVVAWPKTVRLAAVRRLFGPVHAELTKSEAALEYVWKDETRIDGTKFELGKPSFKRNNKRDWDAIKDAAKSGDLEHDSIDGATFVQHYRTLRAIATDYIKPAALARTVRVYWGATGTGKSRRAWEEAGMDAYPKDSRTKWWVGYQGQANVVVDEFRGDIDIAHMLRWLDRYPVIVETKGGGMALKATGFWLTSNLDPRLWYPAADQETKDALMRRLEVTHFNGAI